MPSPFSRKNSEAAAAADAPPRDSGTPSGSTAREPVPLALAALHLTVISAFAIAQPLLNLLGKYPAFFAAHESSSLQVLAFCLVLLLLPPAVLILVEFLVGLVSEAARWGVHLVFIALLAAIFALQISRKFADGAGVVFVLAVVLGIAGAVLYARAAPVRSIVSFLGFAPLLFAILFIFISPVSKIILSGSAKSYTVPNGQRPPIVLLVFDAFPQELIRDGKGNVDAKRYPAFAELAREGTWYKNATTAHENTVFSVPSILDGNFPKTGTHPILADHPNNLFTLLASAYKINDQEVATNLCPPGKCSHADEPSFAKKLKTLVSDTSVVYEYLTLPKNLQNRLPAVDDRWANFRSNDSGTASAGAGKNPSAKSVLAALRGMRPRVYNDSVKRIGTLGPGPELTFIHTLLPHEPRQYDENSRQYPAGASRDSSTEGPPSFNNRFLTEQGHARDLLQAGFTDRLVGSAIDRLKQQGLWDKAMFIVVSDHGESYRTKATPAPAFVPGKLGYRRAVTPANIGDIAPIPLFIKYPAEKKGRVDERYVKTIDILPTIAAQLRFKLPFTVDGRSMLDPAYRGRPQVVVEKTAGGNVTVSPAELEAKRKVSLAHQTALFGDTWASLYRYGPDPDLIGKPVSSLKVVSGEGFTVSIRGGEAKPFANVDPDGATLPLQVEGQVKEGAPAGHDLAAALNGKIVATGETFAPIGPNKLEVSLLLPGSAFRAGRNDLRIYEIRPGNELRLVADAP
jgi:Sulfatase